MMDHIRLAHQLHLHVQHSHTWQPHGNLIVHPSGNTSSRKAGTKTETCRAHREVRDGEPEQGYQLRDDRNKGEDGAVELVTRTLSVQNMS